MEYVTPEDVALCMLLHSYLCPDDASDPAPLSRLHHRLGEALLRETRRWHDMPSPSLVELLQRLEASAAHCRQHQQPARRACTDMCAVWHIS